MIEGIKHDIGKLEYHLVPAQCLEELIKVYMYGKKLYGENNWQKVEPIIRYQDALERHLAEYKKGNTHDAESGLPHLAHCAWNCFALLWFELNNNA